jgi:hypothetical protein
MLNNGEQAEYTAAGCGLTDVQTNTAIANEPVRRAG